jgi:hypothetical protein
VTEAEKLAERMRAGHAEGLEAGLAAPAEFLGDQVECLHLPPHPTDGLRPGAELRALWTEEAALMRGTMPDAAMRDVKVTAGDDAVELAAVLTGTAPDGTRIEHPFHVQYTLSQGRIVKALASYEPEPVAALNEQIFGDYVRERG